MDGKCRRQADHHLSGIEVTVEELQLHEEDGDEAGGEYELVHGEALQHGGRGLRWEHSAKQPIPGDEEERQRCSSK